MTSWQSPLTSKPVPTWRWASPPEEVGNDGGLASVVGTRGRRARYCGEPRGIPGDEVRRHWAPALFRRRSASFPSSKYQAPQAEGSGIVVTGWPSRLALVDGASSVAEAGGGAARHTRAWSVGVLSVVADCRRLRFRRVASKVPAASRARQGWAVSGPSEVARQWPMTTNDDHQAHKPTAPDQQIPSSPRSPARPRARRQVLAHPWRLHRPWAKHPSPLLRTSIDHVLECHTHKAPKGTRQPSASPMIT